MLQRDGERSGRGEAKEAPILSLRGLTKRYGPALEVLSEVSLDVRRGEFLTFLGPSGSGKTTTLMLIAGFQAASAGSVCIEGRDVTHLAPHKRDLGVVFQSYALFPHMTVAQNVAFPLGLRKLGRAEIDRRVGEALELVHLAGLGSRRIAQLSGGQQQRVALARALVYRPKIVLMDEPLGALDRALRESMQREFRQIHRTLGMTFIYVTHDQDEALTMSDRIAVFRGGRIVQIAPPAEIYRRPADTFVARFLGESNVFPGRVAASDGASATIRFARDGEIRVRNEALPADGSAVDVAIRPEAFAIGGDGPRTLRGAVTDLAFHGDHLRLVVDLGEGVRVTVKSMAGGAAIPAVGAPVTLSIPDEDQALIFPRNP